MDLSCVLICIYSNDQPEMMSMTCLSSQLPFCDLPFHCSWKSDTLGVARRIFAESWKLPQGFCFLSLSLPPAHFRILLAASHISLHFCVFDTSATMSNGQQDGYSQNFEAADSCYGEQLTGSQQRRVSSSHQSQPTYVNPSGLVSTGVYINFFADS